MDNYTAQVNDNGLVERVIIGNAEWAHELLGGEWHDTQQLIGIGWTWDGQHFLPPVASDEPSEEVDG